MEKESGQSAEKGVLALAFMTYDLFIIPASVFHWEQSMKDFVHAVQILSTAYWLLDIPASFFTAVYVNNTLLTKPSDIAKEYLKTWFFFDVFIVIPEILLWGGQADAQGVGLVHVLVFSKYVKVGKSSIHCTHKSTGSDPPILGRLRGYSSIAREMGAELTYAPILFVSHNPWMAELAESFIHNYLKVYHPEICLDHTSSKKGAAGHETYDLAGLNMVLSAASFAASRTVDQLTSGKKTFMAVSSRVTMRVALLLIGALVRPLGGLWPFAVGSENQTCDKGGAGSCPTEGHEPYSTRGSEPSPGASYWWFDWSWEGSTEPKASTPQAEDAHSRRWYFRILAGVLWEIWEGGLTWCGTLCASIGLAARWTYWLATTTILLGMLQLTYWTYAWVVRPIFVVIGALLQYVAGRGTWEAVLRGRAPRPGEEEGRTPRHDLSETESEEEDNPCQADAIAWKEGTQTKRLSKERCKDESYDLSKTRRACSVEGCGKVAQTVKGSQKEVHQPWRGARPAAFAGCHTQARNADQVLTGLTWEEIAGIPDEDLRKRAIFLKQRGATPGPTSGGPDRSASRTDAPDDSQALFAYMEARLQGKGHDSAVEVSEVDGRTPSERQRRLRELARRHCIRITSELPAEASKFIWELAQPQVSTDGQPGGGFYPWTASDPGPPSHHQSRTSPWAAPAPERPWAAQGSDHRPTAQALFRQNPGAGGAGGRTDAVDALAQATRAFRAGAFTDAEAPAADETTKALQAIAKSLTSKEDALAQERGKLASIGRLEERLVFLLRGCDSLSVTLCPGVVGKELFHALRIAGTQARPQLRKIEFPCNIQNRHSYGFAALQLGGKTLNTLPEYCLSAGDFPLTSEEDFDNYGGSPDLKLERKGRYPNTLTSWFRAALRQSWAFSCLFGEEYYPVLEKAASHLLRLGEQHGYAWPASAVYGAWEELWARFCEEARELDRRIRRAMQDESELLGDKTYNGQPWLQLPGTFRLDDDTQYFCTDMLPRMQRQLSRACWAGAQKKGNTGGRAAGEGDATEARTEPGVPPPPKEGRAGGEAADKAAPPKLLGPSLTPKEAARSLDHRPKDQQGQYLCWDFLTHRGCNKGHVVADLDNVLPTDREETLGALLKDEGSNWWRDVDADAATLTCPSSKFEKSARADAMRVVDAAEPALGPYPTGLVGVYLRNRLLRLREETGRAPELEDVTHLLEEAVSLGGPELSEEAARLLEERGIHRKAGESPLVQLSGLTWNSTIGTLTWKGVGHWAMYDYQDQLPLSSEACEQMGFAAACDEPKQCLLLHVAAAYLATPDQPLPTPEAVWALASEWRVRWCSQARVAEDSLGPTPERLTQAEADVRVFHHDLLHFGHDRDYRTLVAHPLEEWECLGLAVLRLDAYMRPSVEVVCGRRYSGKAEDTRWVLVHRGHMRLLVPDESCLPPLGSRELEAAGWEAYLEEAEGSPLLDAGRLLQCQVSHPKRAPGSFRTGREAGAFGLQVLRAGRGHSVEARSGPDKHTAAPAISTKSVDWPLLSCLPPAGGVSCLWLLPAALPPGPPADEWSSVLRLAAAQLQTGGRCVLEAPLYRRAWTDKATRIQLAGACWHAERLPSPLLGPAGGVTMLRASFCVPPGLAALCSTGGGEEDFASKMQRLKTVLDNPAGEAERKSQEADLSEGTGDSVRCGKLFADSGPLLGPPPSWLPKSLSKEAEEAAEAYLQKVHQVEYSLEAWNGAVQAGTTLLRLCGGWKGTVGALRYAWRARGEDHFAGLFDHHLDSHLPEDLLAWVRRGKGRVPWHAACPG
ncbi:TRPT1 [Symbiodinium sp. CCMP2592]|nr:TRPT1 [Symbiodinium sp. CCMP2592]